MKLDYEELSYEFAQDEEVQYSAIEVAIAKDPALIADLLVGYLRDDTAKGQEALDAFLDEIVWEAAQNEAILAEATLREVRWEEARDDALLTE